MTATVPTSRVSTLVVTAVERPTDRVRVLHLAAPDGGVLPGYSPGANLQINAGGKWNSYSLTGLGIAPSEYSVGVLDQSGGSRWIHGNLAVGSEVEVRGPENAFAPDLSGRRVFLVAGGIGVTPVVALAARVARSGRPWRMLCLARTAGTMPYLPELRSTYGGAVTFHGSAAGRLDLVGALADLPRGTAVYVCGPGTLADDVAAAVAGQPAVDVFTEQFTAPESSGTNTSFDVSLASTGDTVTVPSDASVLQVLEAHGTPVASSCREGMCGTCEVDVVSGEVDHRDSVLTPEERGENESMMVCVSRCVSGRLVLDL